MREQEVKDLYKAYSLVHQPQEEVEKLDEEAPERITKSTKNKRLMKDAGPARVHNPVKEETDPFDIIRSYLLEGGYAETPEAAFAIMANMSEGWRQSIVEAQEARNNPEDYEERQRKAKSKKQKAMEDPNTGINSPAFAAFMKRQGR
jgi:hypothetical protein